MQFSIFTLINLVTLQIVVTVLLSSVQGPVVSFLPRKCQIGREGRREHEQTEKHINPKLCAEIERTCAHFFLSFCITGKCKSIGVRVGCKCFLMFG